MPVFLAIMSGLITWGVAQLAFTTHNQAHIEKIRVINQGVVHEYEWKKDEARITE
jgi:hypothetical protein